MQRLGPARVVVTDRRDGVSRAPWDSLNLADHVGDEPGHVAENRRRVAQALGVGDPAVIRAEHGGRVHRVDRPGTAEPGDGLITTRPGLGLLALSADCVTGAIAAPDASALAVFHCGWRGVLSGIAGACVAGLADLGAAPERMMVRLGPAICPACYAVSAEVRAAVAAAAPTAAATTASGEPAVDVVAAVVWQLREAGVGEIAVDSRCTAESAELYSYRRDGVTGRQAVLAVLQGRG